MRPCRSSFLLPHPGICWWVPDHSDVDALTKQAVRQADLPGANGQTALSGAAFASSLSLRRNSTQNAGYAIDFRLIYVTVFSAGALASYYQKGKHHDAYYKINSCLRPIGGNYRGFFSNNAA